MWSKFQPINTSWCVRHAEWVTARSCSLGSLSLDGMLLLVSRSFISWRTQNFNIALTCADGRFVLPHLRTGMITSHIEVFVSQDPVDSLLVRKPHLREVGLRTFVPLNGLPRLPRPSSSWKQIWRKQHSSSDMPLAWHLTRTADLRQVRHRHG